MAKWLWATQRDLIVVAAAIFGMALMLFSMGAAAFTGDEFWTWLAIATMFASMGGLYAHFSWSTGAGGKRDQASPGAFRVGPVRLR